jgi:hypothetical protein
MTDELGMKRALGEIPEILARPSAGDLQAVLPAEPKEVLVLGGSVAGHATEFVNAGFGAALRSPLTFVSSSVLPTRVGAKTVVVAVALSAADAPVLARALVASELGSPVVVYAAGTALGIFRPAGRTVSRVLSEVPRQRLLVYELVAELVDVLEATEIAHGTAVMREAAAERARARISDAGAHRSLAEELARRLGRTFPLLIGAPGAGLAAARWWQAEMAANARVFAHAESTSEYRDALLAGFGQSGDVTRQVATLVLLRCAADPPEAAPVFAAIEEWLAEAVADILTVAGEGPETLAQLVDLALLGDLTSIALAENEGIDPGPAPVIDGQE